ncbi:MAG: hypothetical protein ACE5OR_12710 [bacterium]
MGRDEVIMQAAICPYSLIRSELRAGLMRPGMTRKIEIPTKATRCVQSSDHSETVSERISIKSCSNLRGSTSHFFGPCLYQFSLDFCPRIIYTKEKDFDLRKHAAYWKNEREEMAPNI